MTNWRAVQVPVDKTNPRVRIPPAGVRVRYLSMGSWHADLSKEGSCRLKLTSSWRGK